AEGGISSCQDAAPAHMIRAAPKRATRPRRRPSVVSTAAPSPGVATREDDSPEAVFASAVEALRDIVWWNRGLSQLHRMVPEPEVLDRLILDYQGPFVERVHTPDHYRDALGRPIPWSRLADQCGVHPFVRDAVSAVLFKGQDRSLY